MSTITTKDGTQCSTHKDRVNADLLAFVQA
jgi:hypothetical protein